MTGILISIVIGWFGRWRWVWIPFMVQFIIESLMVIGPGRFMFMDLLAVAVLTLISVGIGYSLGAGAHRLIRRSWPRPKSRFEFRVRERGGQLIIAGVSIIAFYFAWMALIIVSGLSNAWWYFPWSEFQHIGFPFFLVGGGLIGWGVKMSLKITEENRKKENL